MKRLAVVTISLCAFSAAPAVAWDSFGHMEVTAFAWDKLTPAARANAARFLMKNPTYAEWVSGIPEADMDGRARIAFIKGATWPDAIKSNADYVADGAPGSHGNRPPPGPEASQNVGYTDHFMHKYWHFVDQPFSPDETKISPPETPNAQMQIAAFRAKLAEGGADDDVRLYTWFGYCIWSATFTSHCTPHPALRKLRRQAIRAKIW